MYMRRFDMCNELYDIADKTYETIFYTVHDEPL